MSDEDPSMEQHIEQEVQRRLAKTIRQHQSDIESIKAQLNHAQEQIAQQKMLLGQIGATACLFGKLTHQNLLPKPEVFRKGTEVVVVDRDNIHYRHAGQITAVSQENGQVQVHFYEENLPRTWYKIGLDGDPVQLKCTDEDDGTFSVVVADGKTWYLKAAHELGLVSGDDVFVSATTKQILGKVHPSLHQQINSGPIASVKKTTPEGFEVDIKGETVFVSYTAVPVTEGDRVVLDVAQQVILKKLDRETVNFKLSSEFNVGWDDIGGCEEAKKICQEAIEMPLLHPELFAHYGVEKARGLLLYGPPGNGKTLFVRAIASSLARSHGRAMLDKGFIYVKSPEILDKYIGNTEAKIREIFASARRFFLENGYPCVVAFDEFDAIAPQRGTRRSSDIADTIVPMFLGEMDGVDEEQTRTNPLVVVMTNRVEVLDPAITRPGRFSARVKISRPESNTALDILRIHSRNIPFEKENHREAVLAVITQDIFSKTRLLYRVNNEHDFTFANVVSGAMLQSIVEMAKMNALHRDLSNNTRTGISMDDCRKAVDSMYDQQRGMNHSYDLVDFAEKLGIQAQDMKYERCYGAA